MEDFFQRPWGGYTILRDQQEHGWALKTLFVHPRAQLSVQRHKLRDETWILVQGSGWSGEGYPVRWTPLDSTNGRPYQYKRGKDPQFKKYFALSRAIRW
jgi:hypothetical protein